MTEKELRQKVVATAESYVGCKEADGSHRKIIDLYNSHKPLARGYAVKYTDAWCSTFASAVAIACGLTDIIPTECGCEKHIQLFKALGAWVENDAYVPKLGDYIFYDWQDGENYATTDNTGAADHVGIVTGISGNTITVTEGNMSDAVGHRKLKVNGRYIRGFGTPNYAAKAASMGAGGVTTPPSAEKPTGGTTGATVTPYLVRVKITNLNIRKGPGTNYGATGYIQPGIYTIVAESTGKGAAKWGKLKSGAGWISLDYATKT